MTISRMFSVVSLQFSKIQGKYNFLMVDKLYLWLVREMISLICCWYMVLMPFLSYNPSATPVYYIFLESNSLDVGHLYPNTLLSVWPNATTWSHGDLAGWCICWPSAWWLEGCTVSCQFDSVASRPSSILSTLSQWSHTGSQWTHLLANMCYCWFGPSATHPAAQDDTLCFLWHCCLPRLSSQ